MLSTSNSTSPGLPSTRAITATKMPTPPSTTNVCAALKRAGRQDVLEQVDREQVRRADHAATDAHEQGRDQNAGVSPSVSSSIRARSRNRSNIS